MYNDKLRNALKYLFIKNKQTNKKPLYKLYSTNWLRFQRNQSQTSIVDQKSMSNLSKVNTILLQTMAFKCVFYISSKLFVSKE